MWDEVRRALLRMLRKLSGWAVRTTLLLLMIVGLLAGAFVAYAVYEDSPRRYIERKTGYRPAVRPALTEAYEDTRYSHGREWDMIRVYRFPREDAGLVEFMRTAESWQELPLPEWVQGAQALTGPYEAHAAQMAAAQSGWWYVDDWLQDIYVYDAEARVLYLRVTSVYVWPHTWEE